MANASRKRPKRITRGRSINPEAVPKRKPRKRTTELEDLFLSQLKEKGLDLGLIREFAFHSRTDCDKDCLCGNAGKGRRWKSDFAWPALGLIVEVEGGVHTRGRHVRPQGFINDCEKYNFAGALGYTVVRLVPGTIKDMSGIELVESILRARSYGEGGV